MIPPIKEPKVRPYFVTGFEKERSWPIYGPEIDSIPTTTVHSIEEYLQLCKSIEQNSDDNSKVLYRGQTSEYLIPGTRQISLLPPLARSAHRKLSHSYMRDITYGYQEYMTEMVDQHITFVSHSKTEAERLRKLMRSYWIPFHSEDSFATTPISRFLEELYSTLENPILFEASLQHYGFPTLNIDATYSPLVALYFATHKFKKSITGVLSSYPTWKEGSVYVMSVPDRSIQYTRDKPEWEFYNGRVSFEDSCLVFYHNRPIFADLYDLTLDNDCRARRQYGVLLTEVGNVDLSDPLQLNAYSFYINHIVRMSKSFWKSDSTFRFVESDLGGWFFPSTEVDFLFRKLLSKSPDNFPVYDLGKWQYHSDPTCRFEFINPLRIVLTGSDAPEVLRILEPTWHGRMGRLEVLAKSEVLRMAADSEEKEVLDIVVACEPASSDAKRLQKEILNLSYSSGRLFVTISTGHRGLYRKPTLQVAENGGVLYVTSDDPYDSEFMLQQDIFSAMLLLTKTKYNRKMKPDAEKWESFIYYSASGRSNVY